MSESLLDRLGGEATLREIVDDFIERVTSDLMIGFLFDGVDRQQLKLREFEFARAHLGGGMGYTGRPMRKAHAHKKILGGMFNRRLRLLEKTLDDHGVAPEVRDAWVAHNESLRSQITADGKTACND